MTSIFKFGEDHLSPDLLSSIAAGTTQAIISQEAKIGIERSSKIVEKIANGTKAVYGINTGFGSLCTERITPEQTRLLQINILKSHAVGVGAYIAEGISKYMMILKVHNLSFGYSGIGLATLNRIIWHIDNDIIPLVPSQGSVGASGDLAPLAHLFLPLIGLGEVMYKGEIRATKDVLDEFQLMPIDLGPKEGLALINGTQFIAAHASNIVLRMRNLIDHADLIGAMMIEGLSASIMPFREELHKLRPYQGSITTARNLSKLLKDSKIVAAHMDCDKVQDPYSLRCMPQVHGAARNALIHLEELVAIEINAVTDNPVVFSEELVISGGNFHGQPLAMPIDYICLAASEISNISDRRIYLSLEGIHANVPKLLMTDTGINSGFMILQYTTAALASENKGQCFPASADSIPTSLGQEDHVSMGSISARKALRVIENTEKVLAIEIICAAQAIEFHRPNKSSDAIERVHAQIRKQIPFFEKDQVFYPYIEYAAKLISSGQLIKLADL
ncbi:MAG: histidine ammonia-lyase [Saprospiraceae bacterium]|jgi:histidine ammonia-lyase